MSSVITSTFWIVLQSFAVAFLGLVSGLYIFQATHTPQPIFSRRECWIIGVACFVAAVVIGTAQRFKL